MHPNGEGCSRGRTRHNKMLCDELTSYFTDLFDGSYHLSLS